MGCNCKDMKKKAESVQGLKEPEESYRKAFLEESKKTAQLSASLRTMQSELERIRSRLASPDPGGPRLGSG